MNGCSRTLKRWSAGVLSAAVTFGLNTALVAQEQRSDRLEEIVVTAQKREENLQTVPLALSAFSAELLESQHVQNLQDLKVRVPSLVFDEYSPGQPRYYIRGIGNNLQSGAVDEDVGVFVDGVYLGRPSMTNTEFLDLERVEILRGPQGTLFGRNVVGGAISFTTRKPTNEVHMGGDVTAGNYNEIGGSGFLSGPLAEKVFASVSAVTRNHDGYAFNTTTGHRVGDDQFSAGRASLRFVPTDDLDIQLNADISRRRGDGQWWVFEKNTQQSFTQPSPDPWRSGNLADEGVNDVDTDGASLSLDWNTGLGKFTSISAYRHSAFDSASDVTQPNVPPGTTQAEQQDELATGAFSNFSFIQEYHERARQWTQEFRLASLSEKPLKWLLGAYYYNDDVNYTSINSYDANFPDFFIIHTTGAYGGDQESTTNAYALFAHAGYDITDNLTVEGGVRWSHDEKDADITARGIPIGVVFAGPGANWTNGGVPYPVTEGVVYTASVKDDWSAWTPTLSLMWQFMLDKFVYGTVSRGFKSGGFGSAQTERDSTLTPLDPETAWNYEVGTKTEWLDHRLRVNVTAFWVDYKDLQVRGLTQEPGSPLPTGVLINAGKTTSKGIETEFNAIVGKGLSVFGSYTYTKSKIEKVTDPRAASILNVGDELIKTPRHKVFIGASYSMPLGDSLTATARADYSYSSKYFPQLPNDNPQCGAGFPRCEEISSATKLNAGLLFEGREGHWGLELWGKNLTDEVTFNSLTAVSFYGVSGFLDPPRTYGATVHFRN